MSFSHRNTLERMLSLCKLGLCVALVIFPPISRAADITLEGHFTAADGVQLFNISIAAPGSVDIRSYGYAAGTTSTGVAVPRGGFDSVLTLFNASEFSSAMTMKERASRRTRRQVSRRTRA